MRRKQGNFFVLMGAAHCALMAFASLYALGKMPHLLVTPQRWNSLYGGYALYLYVGSAAMILSQSFKTEVYLPQAILDLFVGAVPFQASFWALRRILVRWPAFPWVSLLPGLFLIYYGLQLRRGRGLFRMLDLD
ncbi:MAG: hypothetical protein HY926_12130 [Elusimicrobia bacterium]|nr:hypothetical protein [Elusimicrobiota bacterium]